MKEGRALARPFFLCDLQVYGTIIFDKAPTLRKQREGWGTRQDNGTQKSKTAECRRKRDTRRYKRKGTASQ